MQKKRLSEASGYLSYCIVIDCHDYLNITPDDEDNIVAALDSEHLDRVCFCWASRSWVAVGKDCKDDAGAISGSRTSSDFLGVWGIVPVLLGVFLGRNTFSGVLYLALSIYRYLLLSASSLVELKLPPTGCIALEARAVTALH